MRIRFLPLSLHQFTQHRQCTAVLLAILIDVSYTPLIAIHTIEILISYSSWRNSTFLRPACVCVFVLKQSSCCRCASLTFRINSIKYQLRLPAAYPDVVVFGTSKAYFRVFLKHAGYLTATEPLQYTFEAQERHSFI